MTDIIETELSELDERIIEAIASEDLHTYADIAEEIGESAIAVYDHLKKLVLRDVLVQVKGPPLRYYLPGTVKPEAEGRTKDEYPNIRRQIGSKPPKPMPPCPECGGPMKTATSKKCRDCYQGKSKAAPVTAGVDESQTHEPGGQDQATLDEQESAGGVEASEQERSASSLKTPKEVESSNTAGNSRPQPAAPVIQDTAGVGAFLDHNVEVLAGLGYKHLTPEIRVAGLEENHEIELSDGGSLYISICGDLFELPPIERDLIEGIIQLVQAFEGKTA